MTNLEPIKARLAAATPGPWAWASAPAEGSSETPAEYVANALTGDGPLFVVWVPSTEGAAGGYVLTAVTGDGPHASFDAEFIGHAPEDIRALLAEVKRLQAQIDEVKALHCQDAVQPRYCAECSDFGTDQFPAGELIEWPCPTLLAFHGDES